VDRAIAEGVDVVALSGDVVDKANRYFEAVGPLEKGLRRLAEVEITTVAVAGNHDHDVLPELARTLPARAFRLLGAGGRWERTQIKGKGGDTLLIDGWSFPRERVRESPLAGYEPALEGETPVLGLLHADLDVSGSDYAPVTLGELQATPVHCWILGHVHAPALHERAGAPPVLYPGSPQPMDPGEPGLHGVWLLELRPGVPARPRRIPLATVRYETLSIELGEVRQAGELRPYVVEQIRSAAADYARESEGLRYLSLRLRLVGSTPLHGKVETELARLPDDLALEVNGAEVLVERVDDETRAPHDLRGLAVGSDAVAVLARLIQALDAGETTPEMDGLLRAAEGAARELLAAKRYQPIADVSRELGRDALRAAVLHEARRLLDTLLAQSEAA
jgi:exonuclease SbcD